MTLGPTAGETPRLTESPVDEKVDLKGEQPSLSKRTAGGLARFLTLLTGSVIAAGLGGCASQEQRPEERSQKYPENYKAELLEYFHGSLNDPTKIREAAIADPVLKPINEIRNSFGSADSGGSGRGGRRRGGRSGGSDLT